jgi:2-methylcitrate dehydratase PrpD
MRKKISPLMSTLSSHISSATRRKLPKAVVDRAKIHMLDTFGAMIAGSQLKPGRKACEFVGAMKAERAAGVIGTRTVTSPQYAALANGMCGHAAETDDTHPPSRTHPGTAVLPAALAIAEAEDLSGAELLRAVVLGYDLCARTLLALAPTAASRPACCNGAFGHLFGAAAASAALLRLDPRQVRYALAYAGQQASGLYTRLRDTEHIEKAYAVGGMPAHNGVMAALMARAGFTGVEDLYSGDDNFFETYSPDGDPEALVRGLGETFEIMRGGIKRWCVGGPAQAPLDVLHTMMQEHGFTSGQIASLTVRMPDSELKIVSDRGMTNISLQHLLALMAVDGTVTFTSARDGKRVKDPRIVKLKKRIGAIADASIPNKVRGWRCGMDITLTDGKKLTGSTMASKGSYENPLTPYDIADKVRGLITPVIGLRRAERLIGAVAAIETVGNVRELRTLYVR